MTKRVGDWNCPQCNGLIFARNNHCRKCNVDKTGNPVSNKRAGDWNCPQCNGLIFARNNHCRKCNVDKTGNPVSNKRAGDWNCPNCAVMIFASKDRCFKCNFQKADLYLTTDTLCVICQDRPRSATFIHDDDAHFVTCYPCGLQIFESTRECPLCRKSITHVIKTYD